ncbi:hypothetical protein OQA88_568 [Cercophora sp. LCS_1]
MDTPTAQADAVRSAVSSISTCSPATSALLKSLLLPNDDASVAKGPRARTNTAAPAGAKKGNASAGGEKKDLSVRDRAALATKVVNTLIKTLGEAAKPTPPTPSSPTLRPTQDADVPKAGNPRTLRRSSSAPVTPLQPRTTNGQPLSPVATKNGRAQSTNTTGILSAAECARVALAALRQIRDMGKLSFPPLQLEVAMSTVVAKLVALGLYDHAVREIRILKKKLEGATERVEPVKGGKASTMEAKAAAQSVAELLDFHAADVSGQALHLVATTQVQVLQILAATNKPSSVEAALTYLRPDRKFSPTNTIRALAETKGADAEKSIRLMERVAYYLLAMTPKLSSKEDAVAQDSRLNISPESALELQALALEARQHWWKLAKHKGDFDKDFTTPLSLYLAAYVRRTPAKGHPVYARCNEVFHRLWSQLDSQRFVPSRGSRSPLASIYQTLAALARESNQLISAEGWVMKLRDWIRDGKESAAKTCSVAAQLLSIQLKHPTRAVFDDLLHEVVSGIQAPLRGDSAELDELLNNICAARRAAVNLLIALNAGNKTLDYAPSDATRGNLETLVLQCPRFCLRWLGKPPGPTSSTKDYVRYEQRRQYLRETIHHTLDSALMTIKTCLDRKRLAWDQMDSILSDCTTLLDYMGAAASTDTASSYYVKMSNFYYMQFYSLRQQSKDPKDPAPMRALRKSVDCMRDRPSEEKEKSQFLLKLEKLADVCRLLGRKSESLSALETVRSSLIEDGVLTTVAQTLGSLSIAAAWGHSNKAQALSRTLVSISKAEQGSVDWVASLSEAEQAAALEHRLHFILLRGGQNENVPLEHPIVDSLLRIYIPTRFPIRRFRVLLDLLCASVGRGDQAELLSVIRDASQLDEHEQLGDDSGLASYIPHFKAFFDSLTALVDSCQDIGVLQQSVSAWQSIVNACKSKMDLEAAIDDIAGLLDHLQSVADFLRMKGRDSLRASVLELSAQISHMAEGPAAEDLIHYDASLALQYSNLGQSAKAEQIFSKALEYAGSHEVLGDAVANFHLNFAEHFVAIGNFKKAEDHLAQAQGAFLSDLPNRKAQPGQRKHLVTYAAYLHSFLAQERGDSHHALIYARESVRSLYQDWVDLESSLSRSSSAPSSSADASALSLSSTVIKDEELAQNPGPGFWKLFSVLYRNLVRLSALHAHLGMFQETLYYAEQAQKLAKCANSELYNAHIATWMGSMYAKASNPAKSLEMLEEASSLLPDEEGSYFSADLARQISSLYLTLKNTEGADTMLAKAEAFIESLVPKAAVGEAVDMVALENKVAKLKIDDKPAARTTRRVARQPAAKKPVKATASTKAKAVAQPKPPVAVEDVQLSKLRASVLVQKAVTMLGRKEWSAALTALGEATEVSKTQGLLPAGQVAMAACLMGMSMDQMAQDPVFSVIQDSTISFPAISSNEKNGADRQSPLKATPPKKGRGAAAQRAAAKDESRVYVENLKQAQDYLLQAHSVAALSGDASLVHKISGMLQNIGLLLTATSFKAKAATSSAHTSYSVELARNVTWRRERKVITLEKNKPAFEGLNWPPVLSSVGPRRSSLGFTLDLFRFQRDYIDIIPKPWSVISLSLSENSHDLCITKLQAGHSPFVIRLPLERASSRDMDNEVFNFHQGRAELLDIIKQTNDTCHNAKELVGAKGEKTAWWEEREVLDSRLKELLENIEQIWLGGFRGIFSQHMRRPDLLARFQKRFLTILDKHLPSRQQVRGKKTKAAQATKVTLDTRVLELFIGLGDASEPDCDFDEELTDLLYFVVDILQFHGETNAYDEIDFDSMVVETFDALHSYHAAVKSNEGNSGVHTILMLDKSLHVFPWESLPCLRDCAVSRMPSLACLRRLLQEQRTGRELAVTPVNDQPAEPTRSTPEGHHVSFNSGTYILNPSADLKNTEATFAGPLAKNLPSSTWRQVVGRPPTETEFETVLTDNDILLYFGHGSGAQYIRGRTIRRLDRCRATVLLMGCSSAHLTDAGEFEVYGPAWNYMMAGCPAVVGTLWDVTDRDIDRFAGRLFEEWGLMKTGTFEEKKLAKGQRDWGVDGRRKGVKRELGRDNAGKVSLVEAARRARDACRFRYATAAAVAVYGIPVYVDK